VFATCSFPEFKPHMGVPVRISNGFPRYGLKYQLEHTMRDLYPDKTTMTFEFDAFADRYFSKLNSVGADSIRRQAQEIRVKEDVPEDTVVVLLCFEQLTKKPWCHRNMFAAWWKRATGEDVPELGAVPKPEIKAQEQDGLF
jgi:hypothetical protein